MDNSIIKVGDTVEYLSVVGYLHVKVLKIKPDGKLILDTRSDNKLVKSTSRYKDGDMIDLSKNVCVMPHRVKKLKF